MTQTPTPSPTPTPITYRTKLGVELRGTFAQIAQAANALGEQLDLAQIPESQINVPDGWYFSKSKGIVVKITEMHPSHAWKAFRRRLTEHLTDIDDNVKYPKITDKVNQFAKFGADRLNQRLLSRAIETA